MHNIMKPSPVFQQIARAGFDIDWKDKTVLDFGGNVGRLLTSSNGLIKPEHYTCIDVDQESLDIGKERFPNATWIKSNEYNHTWNPDGDSELIINGMYDIITCFYVFVHMNESEIRKYIEYLYTRLNPGGKMICSFPSVERTLPFALVKSEMASNIDDIVLETKSLDVCYIMSSGGKAYVQDDCDGYYNLCYINSDYFINTCLNKYTHEYRNNTNEYDRFVITKE